jgi:cold shock CspA family protein
MLAVLTDPAFSCIQSEGHKNMDEGQRVEFAVEQ